MIGRIARSIRNRSRSWFKQKGLAIIRRDFSKIPFCIISNDCFGGEIYRITGKQYNTPFIGLMLMAPCFTKLIQHPEQYLSYSLSFIKNSMYPERQQALAFAPYPVAMLGDIEIHFLHYRNEAEAEEKWKRRLERLDRKNYSVIFSVGKDYSSNEQIDCVRQMGRQNVLLLGPEDLGNISNYRQLPEMEKDATKAFIQSFRYVDIFNFLYTGNFGFSSRFQKLKGYFYYKVLSA